MQIARNLPGLLIEGHLLDMCSYTSTSTQEALFAGLQSGTLLAVIVAMQMSTENTWLR